MDGRTWFPLTGYAEHRVWVRYEGDRLLYLEDASTGEGLLTSFLPGDAWPAPARQCRQTGEAQGTRVKYDGPRGPIDGALEIRYSAGGCFDAGLLSELYAENIGMVRRTVQTFAGPRSYDLVSARLVAANIETAPNGRFSVVVDGVNGKEVSLTLRLEVNHAGPLSLAFGSSQEYDVAVIDEAGKGVYQWSASRTFLQSLHSVEVDGEWSMFVPIPRPNSGRYTVHAWLTTASQVPMFAATVPLVIAP
jgi:hypothetical protein